MAMTRARRANAALAEIAAERERQVNVEGWSEKHDDEHDDEQLSTAAAAYALGPSNWRVNGKTDPPEWWPWDKSWWKPGDHRRNLVKAGALIVAELERLDRLDGLGPNYAERKIWLLDFAGESEWIVHPGPDSAAVKAWYEQETGVDFDEEAGEECACTMLPADHMLGINDEDQGVIEQTCARWASEIRGRPAIIASTVC